MANEKTQQPSAAKKDSNPLARFMSKGNFNSQVQAEEKRRSSGSTIGNFGWKIKTPGKYVVRFFHNPNEETKAFFFGYATHFIDGKSFYCLKDAGVGDCPGCRYASEVWKRKTKIEGENKGGPLHELFKQVVKKDRYVYNALIRSSANNEQDLVTVLDLSPGLHKKIMDIVKEIQDDNKNNPDSRKHEISCPINGFDLAIKRKDENDNVSYTVEKHNYKPDQDDQTWLVGSSKNMEESVKQMDEIIAKYKDLETLVELPDPEEIREHCKKAYYELTNPVPFDSDAAPVGRAPARPAAATAQPEQEESPAPSEEGDENEPEMVRRIRERVGA